MSPKHHIKPRETHTQSGRCMKVKYCSVCLCAVVLIILWGQITQSHCEDMFGDKLKAPLGKSLHFRVKT